MAYTPRQQFEQICQGLKVMIGGGRQSIVKLKYEPTGSAFSRERDQDGKGETQTPFRGILLTTKFLLGT